MNAAFVVVSSAGQHMDRARTIASVLHGRLKRLSLPEQPQPPTWAQRLPEARTPGPARQAAQMMDARTQAIGEQLAARPEPWLVDRLGMPPRQPGALRDDWVSRAGRAGFYRQAHGITDPGVALGPRPDGGPELQAVWDRAAYVVELRGEDHDVRRASRAELEGTVHVYARAAETAPPDMSRQLGYHRKQAAGLQRQAEQAEADADRLLASDSRAAAAEEAQQADELSVTQDARDAWDRAHEARRLAARAARQELDRRGIQPEPEHREPQHREPESLTEWWRQFEANAEAADQAIGRQRQAAIDAGKPWPPRPDRTAGPSGPKAPKAIEHPQQDGYLPGLKVAEGEPQAEKPEPTQPPAGRNPQPEPGPEVGIGERIDASIRRVQAAGKRAAAELEAQQQERSGYAVRMAQEAQHEAEPASTWPSSRADDRSAETDYEPEI